MASSDLVKEFLAQLDAEDVPVEYISAATIRDLSGEEVTLCGEKLAMLMSSHPDYAHVKDARIFINLNKVANDITIEVEYLMEKVMMLLEDEEERSRRGF